MDTEIWLDMTSSVPRIGCAQEKNQCCKWMKGHSGYSLCRTFCILCWNWKVYRKVGKGMSAEKSNVMVKVAECLWILMLKKNIEEFPHSQNAFLSVLEEAGITYVKDLYHYQHAECYRGHLNSGMSKFLSAWLYNIYNIFAYNILIFYLKRKIKPNSIMCSTTITLYAGRVESWTFSTQHRPVL